MTVEEMLQKMGQEPDLESIKLILRNQANCSHHQEDTPAVCIGQEPEETEPFFRCRLCCNHKDGDCVKLSEIKPLVQARYKLNDSRKKKAKSK